MRRRTRGVVCDTWPECGAHIPYNADGRNNGTTTGQCANCGRSFTFSPSRAQIYCCRGCVSASHRVRTNCACCGKELSLRRSEARRWLLHFCGPECQARYQAAERHPNWKGGNDSWRGTQWKKLRRQIVSERGGMCEGCGQRLPSAALHLHHKRPYAEFGGDWRAANNKSNLSLLCVRCHARAGGLGSAIYSDGALLARLRAVAESLGRRPRVADIRRIGHPTDATYRRRFGSFARAVSLALGTPPMAVD